MSCEIVIYSARYHISQKITPKRFGHKMVSAFLTSIDLIYVSKFGQIYYLYLILVLPVFVLGPLMDKEKNRWYRGKKRPKPLVSFLKTKKNPTNTFNNAPSHDGSILSKNSWFFDQQISFIYGWKYVMERIVQFLSKCSFTHFYNTATVRLVKIKNNKIKKYA